jgi:hypothetical protein
MNLDDTELTFTPTFNTVDELREYLIGRELTDTVYFDSPSFVKAIIGITESGQLIYDYNLMILAAMEEQEWDCEEAIEWIEYNTLRSIPYMGDLHPIVMMPLDY